LAITLSASAFAFDTMQRRHCAFHLFILTSAQSPGHLKKKMGGQSMHMIDDSRQMARPQEMRCTFVPGLMPAKEE